MGRKGVKGWEEEKGRAKEDRSQMWERGMKWRQRGKSKKGNAENRKEG